MGRVLDRIHDAIRRLGSHQPLEQGISHVNTWFGPSATSPRRDGAEVVLPADTPELVQTFPSSVHLAVGTQLTPSPNCVAQAHDALFVVARRPFKTPDCAKLAAPVQTLTKYCSSSNLDAMKS
jgi:hypothetical protein